MDLHKEYDMDAISKIDIDKLLLDHALVTSDIELLADLIELEMRRFVPRIKKDENKDRLEFLERNHQKYLSLRSELLRAEKELAKARDKAITEMEEVRAYLELQYKNHGRVVLPEYKEIINPA